MEKYLMMNEFDLKRVFTEHLESLNMIETLYCHTTTHMVNEYETLQEFIFHSITDENKMQWVATYDDTGLLGNLHEMVEQIKLLDKAFFEHIYKKQRYIDDLQKKLLQSAEKAKSLVSKSSTESALSKYRETTDEQHDNDDHHDDDIVIH